MDEAPSVDALLGKMRDVRSRLLALAAAGRGNRSVRNEAMRRAYEDGWSLSDIGMTLGVSRERVRVLLKQAGVPMRSRVSREAAP